MDEKETRGGGMPLAYIHAFAYFFFQWEEDAVFTKRGCGGLRKGDGEPGVESNGTRRGLDGPAAGKSHSQHFNWCNVTVTANPDRMSSWYQIRRYKIWAGYPVGILKERSEDITWPKIKASQRAMCNKQTNTKWTWQTYVGGLGGLKRLVAFIPCRVACPSISVRESLLTLRNLSIRTANAFRFDFT